MYTYETRLTTRYGETDKMGVIYHANYINYYEIARTEMIRNLGYPYRIMENEGIMMPVIEVQSKYIKPAYYDEELIIRTTVKELPTSRIVFHYEVYSSQNELLNTGKAVLVFMDVKTRRPRRPPEKLLQILQQYLAR
ncbi:MAG: acyl-CoA thioesterase [Prevotellaceae bacterium]|jgi:acyl-CoA thioester hydrolase|nr:acyl-CoA thioesterase [Prevotellaceae bacterium]